MSFREQIRRNRWKLRGFVLAFLLLALWAGRLAGEVFDPGRTPYGEEIYGDTPARGTSAYVHLMTWSVVLLAWVTYRRMRRRGDRLVLGLVKAQPLSERRFANAADEMAIAAGIARPRLWIVDSPVPNALACGLDERTASIAVTRGLLDLLDRDELQAVVAHEVAHIRNGDTRLMTVMLGMTRAFWLLSALVLGPLRAMRERIRKGGQPSERGRKFVEGLSTTQKVLLLVATPVLAVVAGALCVVVSLAITFAFAMFVVALPWLITGYALLDLLLGDRLAELERKTEGIGKLAFFAPVGLATGPAILVLGLFVPLVHVLMRLALSRNREFQADATAVELTRNPRALSTALRKLAQVAPAGRRIERKLSPLTIVPAAGALFSTHPPLMDRIARIDAMAGASAPPPVLV